MNVLRKYKHTAESCCCVSGATLHSHFTLDIISTAHSGSCLLTEVRQTTEGGRWGWSDSGGEGREKLKGKGGRGTSLREITRDRSGGRERQGGGGSCASGRNRSLAQLTSMCHLTVLQIRLHMLHGDVRTYISTVGLNLQRCTVVIFYSTRLFDATATNLDISINKEFDFTLHIHIMTGATCTSMNSCPCFHIYLQVIVWHFRKCTYWYSCRFEKAFCGKVKW